MGLTTGIAWTDATWNPWRGCRKVSAGCAHCYMYREQERYGRDPKSVVRASPETFSAPLRWARAKERPRLVFTCSWSDFFIEDADAWRPDAWTIIRDTPGLTYQILTKRPERISACLPPDWGLGYPNVWLGVSAETIAIAEKRGELLGRVPADLTFLSAEPWLECSGARPSSALRDSYAAALAPFDWVILGGESGPMSRALCLSSAKLVRDTCLDTDVPFFLKQLGGWPNPRSHEEATLDGRTWTQMPWVAGERLESLNLKPAKLEAFL